MPLIFAFHGLGKTYLADINNTAINADTLISQEKNLESIKAQNNFLIKIFPKYINSNTEFLFTNIDLELILSLESLKIPYLIILPREDNLEFYIKNVELHRERGKRLGPRFRKKFFSLKKDLENFPKLQKKIFYLKNNSFLSENFEDIQNFFKKRTT